VFTIDVRHDGLGRFARVSAPSRAQAERRAAVLSQQWNEVFERRQAVLRRGGANVVDALKKLEAEERTEEAERASAALTAILVNTVRTPPVPDWAPLYDTAVFSEPEPAEPAPPKSEPEPQQSEFKREPLTLAVLINPRAMRRRKEAALAKFKTAHDGWQYLKRWREQEHDKALKAFRTVRDEWQVRRAAFSDLQGRANARLDALRAGYGQAEPEAVMGHCDLTLLSLERPENFPCFWTMSFSQGALQIDYDLPSMAQVPVVKAVKYVAAREAFETIVHSEPERERMYGEAVFQTCLAVLHALFTADQANAVKTIAFNGWATYVDGAGSHPGRACILSVTADRRSLAAMDPASVDPQACFRALNGTMSSKLAAMVARLAR
jgi:restriction system protein